MATKILVSLLLLTNLFQLGCSSAPIRFDDKNEGQWEAKALIRDKSARKSFIVNLDISAIQSDKLRVEAVTPLGIHIASYALNGKSVSYVLTRQKKYYKGRSTAQSLRSVLSISLEPKNILAFLFDKPPKSKRWSCESDEKGFLKKCINKRNSVTVIWENRVRDKKTIQIESSRASLQIYLKSFSPKVEDKDGLFVIEKPSAF